MSITASAKLHWITYLRPLLWVTIGVGLMVFASSPLMGGLGLFTVIVIAPISLLRTWFENWTTELAVTDRRVIFKTGFIRRQTVEMNMGKIETVVVNQSILGRLLNFGTILVKGTGQSVERFRSISRPLAVRDSIKAQ
jgi:uncharacterized membrane protein YdbT with pleckstrin-like domain